MKKYCCLTAIFTLLLSAVAYADELSPNLPDNAPPLSQTLMDKELDNQFKINQQQNTNRHQLKTPIAQKDDLPELDIDNFAMIEHALYSSVVLNNIPAIYQLLPIYQAHNDFDNTDKSSRLLLAMSQALLATQKSDYKTGIRLYREILADYPKMVDIRFRLAELLFADKQNEAAKDQLVRLRSESYLNDTDKLLLDQYIQAIDQRGAWEFGGGLNYAYDPNINNSPKKTTFKLNGGTWETQKAKSAHGLNYRLSANKSFDLKDNYYLQFNNNVSGKYYWSNRDYDDTILKTSLGLAYKNAKTEILVSRYYHRRFIGGSRYNKEVGLNAEWSHWFLDRHRLILSAKHGNEMYHGKLKNLSTGRVNEINANYIFVNHARQYWAAGIGYGNKDAHDKSRAYDSRSLYGTWTQEWDKGLSSSLSLSVTKNHYKAKDIVGIQRKDTEYAASLSLWHRNLYFKGITPRLTITHNNTQSNHPFHDLKKSNVFIQFNKIF